MTTSIIRDRIDNGPVSPVMLLVTGIGFMLNLVDGFDVVAMSAAAPALSADWSVTRAELGPIFSSALIGMCIGAAVIAPLADRIGRRAVIIFATAIIGISMIGVAYIPRGEGAIQLLIAVRFVSGLGIGVILVSGAAIASEFAQEKFRNLAVTTAIMGYPFGAMLVGPIANAVIPVQGWEMLFIYGGVATLIMGGFILFALPESPEFLATRSDAPEKYLAKLNRVMKRLGRDPLQALPDPQAIREHRGGSVSGLLTPEFRLDTVCLWTTYFLAFLTLYFLLSWIPTLFVDSGYTRAQGIGALTQFNLGAIIGIIMIGTIATNIRLAKPIGVFFSGAAVLLIALYVWRPDDLFHLNLMIFGIGVLLQGAFTAMYALAARVYPASIRSTGIGWSAGLGRAGAVISPIVAGLLSAGGWNMYALFLVFSIPLVFAAVLVIRFRY